MQHWSSTIHRAFNHRQRWRGANQAGERWQVAPHLSPEALATFVGMWPGPAPELVGLWFPPFLLFVLKLSLYQISLWPPSVATVSPHRTFVQRMRRNHFVKMLSCHHCALVIKIQIHKQNQNNNNKKKRTVKGSLLPQVDTSTTPLSYERTGSPPQTQDLLGLDRGVPASSTVKSQVLW